MAPVSGCLPTATHSLQDMSAAAAAIALDMKPKLEPHPLAAATAMPSQKIKKCAYTDLFPTFMQTYVHTYVYMYNFYAKCSRKSIRRTSSRIYFISSLPIQIVRFTLCAMYIHIRTYVCMYIWVNKVRLIEVLRCLYRAFLKYSTVETRGLILFAFIFVSQQWFGATPPTSWSSSKWCTTIQFSGTPVSRISRAPKKKRTEPGST